MATVSKDEKTAASNAGSQNMPYVTTSDVLRQLNQNLKDMAAPGEELYCQPRFELQKRLPDGSTIPASQEDLKASDFQNKISQSAKFVSQLEPEDRKIWAEQQRQSGNALFHQGQYKEAMDIYLTCLVVKGSGTPAAETDSADTGFVSQTLLPVLNNLAQCTLQLGMQKKTKEFCGVALEEIEKLNIDSQELDPIAFCKIHFKRAKAHRLTGHYSEARQDLNSSLSYVENKEKSSKYEKNENMDGATTGVTKPFRQAIQKEFRHLEAAEKEARKNRQRQKRSMQKAMTTSKLIESRKQVLTTSSTPNLLEPRKYSTLRARRKVSGSSNAAPKVELDRMDVRDLSYWQYYWLVVARVAEMLLLLLGDDEEEEERNSNQDLKSR